MKTLDRRYTTAWLVWGLAFATIETLAYLERRPGCTLTSHSRVFTRKLPGKVLMATGLGWLAVHLLQDTPRTASETPRKRLQSPGGYVVPVRVR